MHAKRACLWYSNVAGLSGKAIACFSAYCTFSELVFEMHGVPVGHMGIDGFSKTWVCVPSHAFDIKSFLLFLEVPTPLLVPLA